MTMKYGDQPVLDTNPILGSHVNWNHPGYHDTNRVPRESRYKNSRVKRQWLQKWNVDKVPYRNKISSKLRKTR